METIPIGLFLTLRESITVVDVRSPKEFLKGHIPGAINLPLLNDEERHLVGIRYKEAGAGGSSSCSGSSSYQQQGAVLLGYELTGHKFSIYLKELIKLARNNELIIHCWRGGLRSKIMSQIAENALLKVHVLEKGYKSFRHWVLNKLEEKRNIKILGGLTGSGKTEYLQQLKEKREQVIDLEGLANHKGSAFGALGKGEQPTQEQFENELSFCWNKIETGKTLWLEDESQNIGKIKIPDAIFKQMREAEVYRLEVSYTERVDRIKNDYGIFPKEDLIACTKKLEKKLGNQDMNKAIEFLNNNCLEDWVKIMLSYYDRLYERGMGKRKMEKIHLFKIGLISN